MTQFSRYFELVRTLAERAMALSEGAAPVTALADPMVSVGLPAARLLLRDDADQYPGLIRGMEALARVGEAEPEHPARFNDTLGFSRPVYHPLLLHLHLKALSLRPAALRGIDRELLVEATRPAKAARKWAEADPPGEYMHLALWWALCLHEAVQAGPEEESATTKVVMDRSGPSPLAAAHDSGPAWGEQARAARLIVQRILNRPGPEGALHSRGDDDLLDAWTFREMTALHALAHLAARENEDEWRACVERAARHHQAYTQPDYTTYQPWALSAFLACPDTVLFADQQLHDTTTNLHLERPGAAVVAGLLLADCVTSNHLV